MIYRGVFYNSKEANCSIHESGKMCYNALKVSEFYTLEYSEDTSLDVSYDFAIFNQHITVNNWITSDIIKQFNKPTFCIVTEVTFNDTPIGMTPDIFDHYIVLDPTVQETEKIHPFGRPLWNYKILNKKNNDIPVIGTFGLATPGKNFDKLLDHINDNFDEAIIRINIPYATHVPSDMQNKILDDMIEHSKKLKNTITFELTRKYMTDTELIEWCSENTINCFFYFRNNNGFNAGLSATTDQAIISERPLLITSDRTFRHIHTYLNFYPNINIKDAIENTIEGVKKMKDDWSTENFVRKFNVIFNSELERFSKLRSTITNNSRLIKWLNIRKI